ncbi:MAG: OmpH family outer membrane protein [Bacteroidales bacterium]|nr:OmpH family outer membrane protein [Bacteroidales bacterium]
MDEFSNEEKNTNEFAGLSPAEQIAQLEKEIKGETVETPAIEENEIKEEENTTVESCSTEKCKCKCGSCISICALILSLAAIVLLILMLTGVLGGKKAEPAQPEEVTIFDKPAGEEPSDIAYIDLDTLLLTYNYAIKLQEDLAMEQKKAEGTIQSRMKKFESMYNAYMEKARTGMFLSAASQQAQQSELEKEQAAIENLQATLSNQLLEKQSAMNQEIYDTVINFVNQYAEGRFKIVLGNMGGVTVVYSQQGMNITNDVVAKLNQRYGGILENDTKAE